MKALAVVFIVLAAASGAEGIQEIRDLYYQTSADIEEGVFYTTVVNINSGDMSFPAVGIFGITITFHWLAEPWNTPANRLVKAVVSSRVSAALESSEFLYDESGELAFCFIEGGYEQVEHRFYFSDGRLLRFIDGDEVNNSPDQSLGTAASNRGAELHQAFMLMH
ncbi:MAG: hypothetical protein R6V62_10595 [Candidatus Fermentibacteraceae bacterium]